MAETDPASRRFVQIKERLLADVALRILPIWVADEADTAQVLDEIAVLNRRPDVDAIFLQFPLPARIDGQVVANALAVPKDIDCSGAIAEAEFHDGRTPFKPVAPQAAFRLLQDALGSVAGQNIVVCGIDDAFARATRTLLARGGASVQLLAPDVPALRGCLHAADALVICEVLPPSDVLSEIEWLPAILDAGYYLPPRPVNWLPAGVAERVGIMLKQYGNVGPGTVAQLARATVRAGARRSAAARAARRPH